MKYEDLLKEAGQSARTGEIGRAFSLYQAALEADPNRVEGYMHLAMWYYRQNRLAEAEALFEKAAAMAPSDASLLNNLGVVQYRQAKLEPAREHLEKALAIDLGYVDAAVNLKRVRFDLIGRRIERAFSTFSLGRFPHLASYVHDLKKEYAALRRLSVPVAERIRGNRGRAPIEDERREILFLSVFPRVDMAKKADALARTGRYRVRLLCSKTAAGVLDGFFGQFFEEVIMYADWIELLYFLLALTPDVIISRPRNQIAALAIVFGNAPVVFNIYDIVSVGMPEEYQDPLVLEAEQFCFEHAAGIIHKGRPDEIDTYIRPLCKIRAPVLHFYPFCWDRYFAPGDSPKLSERDGVPHLVYTGIVSPSSADQKTTGHGQFAPMIEAITNQGIHWHIYYNPETGVHDPYYREYFDLAEQNPYFHFHSPLAYDALCKEIAQYDYGYMVHDVRGTIYSDINVNISMANKIFTYLEAGIPMIVGDTFGAVADFVEQHSVGFVVDPTDLSDLSDRLRMADYERLRSNVLKVREEFSIQKHIPALAELVDRIGPPKKVCQNARRSENGKIKIAGFHSSHDCSFCVLENGIPMVHAELERYIRLKEPFDDALKFLFREYERHHDIQYFTHEHDGWKGGIRPRFPETFNTMASIVDRNQGAFYEPGHHQSHASNAFFSSNFEDALIVTMDGGGWDRARVSPSGEEYGPDFVTAFTLWEGKGNRVSLIKLFPHDELNIGAAWDRCVQTVFGFSIGYPKGNQAGTVMAMSALGDPDRFFGHFYDVRLRADCIDYKKLRELASKDEQTKFDIAAGLQRATEAVTQETLQPYVDACDYEHLCLSGGVALNSVMTGKMYDWFGNKIKRIYVCPVPYDAGLTLGSAQFLWHHVLGHPRIRWEDNFSPYLGVHYASDLIRASLSMHSNRIEFEEVDDDLVLDLLANQNIVSVFGGGSESGRRALGNRSILADPRDRTMKDIVNEKVKHRQWFRPFAPSILREDVKDWFVRDVDSPYMSFVLKFKEEVMDRVPAVVHFDGSARLQTVTEKDNAWYYHFIRKWREKTGVPIVLNTSFNDREPIVETPEHAIRCFLSTHIDYLYFYENRILVHKKRHAAAGSR